MAFNYRKLFENLTSVIPGSPTYCCSLGCRACSLPPPLIPPPSSPSIEDQISRTHHDSYLLTILVAVSGSTLLLVIFSAFFLKYWSGRNRSRAPPPQSDETHEDFLDEDHGPVMEHPIWFITTVGLQDSVINSITVCKYKRGEGLVEGTDCSVCLSEFEEDETLRLLPKCSHAFHLPCIDTWLRSHTNCPLCRAPIVSNTAAPPLTATTEPISDPSGTGDETQVENSVICNRSGEGGVSERRVGTEDEDELQVEDGRREIDIEKEEVSSSHENWGLRVVSDSAENRPEGEDEMQPMRRSVSMDSFSASMLCFSLANLLPMEPEGSSATQLIRAKKSNSGIVAKRGSGNPSIFKMMGSSFTGRSLQRGPISMKRSFSCGGKFLLPRKGRSQSSILPL